MNKVIIKIDGENVIHPDKEMVREIFTECNEKYFDNSLPVPSFDNTPKWMWGAYDRKRQSICINFRKNVYWTKSSLAKVIIHEMIHYQIALKYNPQYIPIFHHLPPFSIYMRRMNKKYGLGITYHTIIPTKETYENGLRTNLYFNSNIKGIILEMRYKKRRH